MLQSAIYIGDVFHRRFDPCEHTLSYRTFFMLLTLDELPALKNISALFAWNRRAWFSFHDTDHGLPENVERQNSKTDLKDQLAALLTKNEIPAKSWSFQLLTMPRTLGYAFNPISLVYCSDEDGRLRAMIYEVNNTFGERFHYVLPVDGDDKHIRQQCSKKLFVSPFFDTQGCYEFDVLKPDEKLSFTIDYLTNNELKLRASFSGRRLSFSSQNLRALLMSNSMTTYKVVAGIHWEAAKLWWKGVPIVNHVPLNTVAPRTREKSDIRSVETSRLSRKNSYNISQYPQSREASIGEIPLSTTEFSIEKEQDEK